MAAALVFLIGDFLPIDNRDITTQQNIVILASSQEAELHEEMDWETYFLLETEMVIAQL